MSETIDLILLDRYRAGECGPLERAQVEQWLAADPSRAALVDWMRSLGSAAAVLPDPWNPQDLWARLQARLDAAPPTVAPAAAPIASLTARRRADIALHRGPSRSHRLLRIAAIVAVILGGVALWRIGSDQPPPLARAGAVSRTFATGSGERAVVTLADGSQVIVDAGSTLRVPRDFGRITRDVQLDGRAYFEVAPDSARPFRVYSGGAVTRVLGTKFVIRAYPEDSTVTVVVREGHVALTALRDTAGPVPAAGGVVLARGDLSMLDRVGRLSLEHGTAVDRYLAWTDGRLEFSNTPLREVIPELVRRYGLEITPADPRVDSLLLTASFHNQSAADVLRVLAASLELEIEQRGTHVVLRLPVSKGPPR